MAGATVAYNNIEQSADRAFAYALLVRQAKAYIYRSVWIFEVARSMDDLLGVLGPTTVEWLAAEKSEIATRVKGRLTELHQVLAGWSRSEELQPSTRLPGLTGHVCRILERTEDLGDIVEAFSLASSTDLLSLVSSCASALGFEEPGKTVGGM